MYDSGISVTEFVAGIRKETDIALPVPNSVYADSINMLQSMLYSEIIKEQGLLSYTNGIPGSQTEDSVCILHPVPNDNNPALQLYDLEVKQAAEGEDVIRFEDIVLVYVNGVELIRTSPASARIFGNSYSKSFSYGNLLMISIDKRTAEAQPAPSEHASNDNKYLNVIYHRRPEVVRVAGSTFSEGNIRLPREFIDLAKCKVRGDVYMVANEDALAAKWNNEYNAMLESFKMWVAAHEPNFGIV